MHCKFCHDKIRGYMPYKCKYCGDNYCSDHRLPENHSCDSLPLRSWENYARRYNQESVHESYSEYAEPRVSHGQDKRQSIPVKLTVLLLLGLILVGAYWQNDLERQKYFDCGKDKSCFERQLKECNASTFSANLEYYLLGKISSNTSPPTTTYFFISEGDEAKITGKRNERDLCEVNFSTLHKIIVIGDTSEIQDLNFQKCFFDKAGVLTNCDSIQEKKYAGITLGCQDENNFRLYKGKCIPIVECQDGTLAPECSSNQPLQCVDGNLIENAGLCGCPFGDSIRQVGNKCVDLSKPDIQELELRIHYYVNKARKANGLKELEYDEKLADIARAHSIDMATNDFFDHHNLRGQDPTARAKAAGYNTYKNLAGGWYSDGIAENIAQNNLYTSTTYINGIETSHAWQTTDQIAASIVNSWMNSPGHRANILNNDYDKEGIGVAISSTDEVLATQDFW